MRHPGLLAGLGTLPLLVAAAPPSPVADLAAIGHGTGKVANFTAHDLTSYPKAVCNDATVPGRYYIALGAMQPPQGTTDQGKAPVHRWVILLQGGGACTGISAQGATGPAACNDRGKLVVPRQPDHGGILSTNPAENPDFYDATKVFVSYCSSDYWSGDTVTPKKPGPFNLQNYHTWSFAGREILDATLTDLLANATPATMPSEVLYTGTSAGGFGVLNTVSDVAARFAALPSPPRFVASPDAGYAIRVPGFDPSGAPPAYLSSKAPFDAALMSGARIWGGRGDLNCVTDPAQAGNPDAALDCRAPEYVLSHGYITVPMLIQQSRKDTAQLCDNGVPRYKNKVDQCPTPPGTNPQAKSAGYAQCFAYLMQTSIGANAIAPNAPRISAYAPDETIHVQSTSNTLFGQQRAVTNFAVPLSDQQALSMWYQHPLLGLDWEATPLEAASLCQPAP